MGSISIGKLLILAVIVALVFGTKRLRSLGSDLGSAIKGFKKAVGDDEEKKAGKDDADFADKTPADKQSTPSPQEKEEVRKDKEQV